MLSDKYIMHLFDCFYVWSFCILVHLLQVFNKLLFLYSHRWIQRKESLYVSQGFCEFVMTKNLRRPPVRHRYVVLSQWFTSSLIIYYRQSVKKTHLNSFTADDRYSSSPVLKNGADWWRWLYETVSMFSW
jgi:hypothetical protein